MLMVETLNEGRPAAGDRVNDAPLRLRHLSDIVKGAAVASGLTQVSGQAFAAEVETLRYAAFDRLQEFRKPAELRVWVTAADGKGCNGLQALADMDIEAAIARSLGEAAGEDYRMRLVDKLYAGSGGPRGELRLTMLVGRV
jgi:hypothetical protein